MYSAELALIYIKGMVSAEGGDHCQHMAVERSMPHAAARILEPSATIEEAREFIASCADAVPRGEFDQASMLPFVELYDDLRSGRARFYQDPQTGRATYISFNARAFIFNSREGVYWVEMGRKYEKNGVSVFVPNFSDEPGQIYTISLFSSSETAEADEVDWPNWLRHPQLADPVKTLTRMLQEEWNIRPERLDLAQIQKTRVYHEDELPQASSVYAGVWRRKHAIYYFLDAHVQVSQSFKRLLHRKDGSKILVRECHPMDAESIQQYVRDRHVRSY